MSHSSDNMDLARLLDRAGISVKPLEWEEFERGMGVVYANTIFGRYVATPSGDWSLSGDWISGGLVEAKGHPSVLAAAKAAAQADFEYRILSALSPASEMEPVAWADRPMEVSAMRELPRDLVTILRTEAKNQRTPPIDYVIAEDGGRMVHRPDPDIAMAELLEEAASALAAKDAELARRDMQLEASAKVALDLSAQLAEARKALDPFAMVAEHDIGEDEADSDAFRPMPKPFNHAPQITVGHLRAARRALTGGQEDGNG